MSSGSLPPPAPPPPPPPSVLSPAPPAPPGSWTNKQVAWIIVAALSGVALLVAFFVAAIFAVVFVALRSSDPYRFAMRTATHDPRVIAKLGSPVSAGGLISGSIKEHDDSGEADLSIPVHGSIHKGAIHVVAKKSGGEWTYQQLTLTVEDAPGQLDLLRPETGVPREE